MVIRNADKIFIMVIFTNRYKKSFNYFFQFPDSPGTNNPLDHQEHRSINLGALFQIESEGAEYNNKKYPQKDVIYFLPFFHSVHSLITWY